MAAVAVKEPKELFALREYELVMLVSPQVADDQVDGVVQRVTGMITSQGGKVAAVKPWGRRRLAYHIGDFQEANYVQTNFSMEPTGAKALVNSLTISEDIIRHLLVKLEA